MTMTKVTFSLALAMSFCLSSVGGAQDMKYKYRLEIGQEKDLCGHMTQVFNRQFKTPWDKGQKPWKPNPTIFGTPYDQVFERFPGVEYKLDFTWELLLSKYPTSPEFEAVRWKEGRVYYPDGNAPPSYNRPAPILITEIDIDNDGQKEWLVKSSFMQQMSTNEGTGQSDGGSDTLTIFLFDGFDPTIPLTLEQLSQGQKQAKRPRQIGREVAQQLRPFIYKGKTYLSAYQTEWRDRDHSNEKKPKYRIYPDREYMNILRVTAGGQRLHSQVTETANTETVCRIRMRMLKNTPSSKGN
jgi:hypothetical protein